MTTTTPEQENVPQTREVPLGQWFKPLENYTAIPYEHQTALHSDKRVAFTTPGFGNWDLTLDWDEN